jgi:ribosome modulation factor/uncharacterized protein (UPF0335 family)
MAKQANGQVTAGSNVSPDTVQALTREFVVARRETAEAQGRYRAIAKRAKASGINVKALAEVVSNRTLDSDEVSRHYRDVMYYAACNDAPYAIQQDLFPTSGMDLHVSADASAEHQEWEASEAGYNAGMHGQSVDACPFPVGSPLAQMWSQSWHRGQAKLAEQLGPGESAPVARGRKRASNQDAAPPPA